MNTKPILVWEYHNAPKAYRELVPNDDDKDWLAFVPTGMMLPYWMDTGSGFGCCSVTEYSVEGGTVYVGAHA